MLYDNKYEYVKPLGEGGFGKVFLARDQVSNRLVAIKELNNRDKANQNDLIHEIEMVARFYQPNIVTYHHHFWQDDLLFLVMEHCAGGSLEQAGANAEENKIFDWVTKLADAFSFVHGQGIVHHDIKPGNILFSDNGVIKISDFGVANTNGGTMCYMAPELFKRQALSSDARIDVYALGVTLMELLIGKNPFRSLSAADIHALHDRSDFPIKSLPFWQQEIILKAINKVPELRFQSMDDFSEAIKSRHVPFVINKKVIKAGDLADKANIALRSKKWKRALYLIEVGEKHDPTNVNVLKAAGKYHLLRQNIPVSKIYYEQALRLNPRLDVQKNLGWINLEQGNYPIAISLLSDHLHRNPSDFEGYNLLLQCFYETGRYEAGMQLASMLMEAAPHISCFANNYYVNCVLQNIGKTIYPDEVMKASDNFFIDYNISVINEILVSHSFKLKPTLKSKLLFQDFRFNVSNKLPGGVEITNHSTGAVNFFNQPIIKVGRNDYGDNDICLRGIAVSRRHCLIVNTKDDVMLYDLGSMGTYLNGEEVKRKMPLLGLNKIIVAGFELSINTDKSKLL